MKASDLSGALLRILGRSPKQDWLETNVDATLRVDVPSLDWKAGDSVSIKRLRNLGNFPTAYVVHGRIGNTLNNMALSLLVVA